MKKLSHIYNQYLDTIEVSVWQNLLFSKYSFPPSLYVKSIFLQSVSFGMWFSLVSKKWVEVWAEAINT